MRNAVADDPERAPTADSPSSRPLRHGPVAKPGARLGPWRLRGTLLALTVLPACSLPHWPVEGPIVSPFGIRMDGLRPEMHRGVDIRIPYGSEVRSMADGQVRFAGQMIGYGTVVWVDHPDGVTSVYGHLSELLVDDGAEVDGNEVIALSGNSGNATGPHLHFEVWKGGREQDPVRMLGGPPEE